MIAPISSNAVPLITLNPTINTWDNTHGSGTEAASPHALVCTYVAATKHIGNLQDILIDSTWLEKW